MTANSVLPTLCIPRPPIVRPSTALHTAQTQREIKRLHKEKRRLDDDYKLQYADYTQAARTTEHTRQVTALSDVFIQVPPSNNHPYS
jgi:hypothetical protein